MLLVFFPWTGQAYPQSMYQCLTKGFIEQGSGFPCTHLISCPLITWSYHVSQPLPRSRILLLDSDSLLRERGKREVSRRGELHHDPCQPFWEDGSIHVGGMTSTYKYTLSHLALALHMDSHPSFHLA